ncbi:hypothetical protein CAC42_3209 [Sphaceloma murrayae]|uniref:Uncharacterized protein n=1 Tax=Sphaceloma murrayae TaxID=2082308 RepID=A0A2K1QRW3_9PEZI|nr:hypothetical protein CAC42_3209 [Sphaceloma murrayae]
MDPSVSYPPLQHHLRTPPVRPVTDAVPLRCNICPKKPDFSDISHLLTHIASKAHLSTYYKTKVRSAQEHASRVLIDEYDSWYARYRIEDLMSERMSMKEHKRKLKASQATNAAPFRSVVNALQHPHMLYEFDELVDPLLHDSVVKQEPDRGTIAPSIEDEYQYDGDTWPPLPWTYGPHGYIQQFGADAEEDGVPTIDSYPETPSSRPTQLFDTMSLFAFDDTIQEEDLKNRDSTLLKGIIWPGMDLFDSATPEMRRKRNQKKSLEVVDRLEATSKEVEATEVVYTPEISVQKSRPITGFPHSSVSPVKRATSSPAKAPRKSTTRRKPLADKSTHATPRAPRKSRARTTSARVTTKARKTEPNTTSTAGSSLAKPKRGRKPKHTTVQHEAESTIETTIHDLENLNTPFTYRESGDDQIRLAAFRPTEPLSHFGGQGSYGIHTTSDDVHTLHDPFDASSVQYDANMLPTWDFLGQELSPMMSNPLFTESQHAADDDDENTISAPMSEQ